MDHILQPSIIFHSLLDPQTILFFVTVCGSFLLYFLLLSLYPWGYLLFFPLVLKYIILAKYPSILFIVFIFYCAML